MTSDPITYQTGQTASSETFEDFYVTSSVTNIDCGDIEFTVTNLDGTPIDPNAFTYNPVTQKFSVQTNDYQYYLDGPTYPFRVQAKYVGAIYQPAGFFDFDVLFLDPCLNPVSLTSTIQTPPPDYYYTG